MFIADAILNSTLRIPLRGIAIGNGWIDANSHYLSYLDYSVKVELIEENTDVRCVFSFPYPISKVLQAWKHVKQETDACTASIERTHTNRMLNKDCLGVMQSVMKAKERKCVIPFFYYHSKSQISFSSVNGVAMCINIYDVRLEDTSPACGMNWPPEMPAIKKILAVIYLFISSVHRSWFFLHSQY